MGIGLGECCCDPQEPECGGCCTPSSISFWLQYNNTSIAFTNCNECDTGAFEVVLSSVSCSVDGAGQWVSFCDFFPICGLSPCTDSLGFYCDPGILSYNAHWPVFSFECVNGCYESSFTGPCWVCLDDESSPFGLNYADQIEYTIRAVSGKLPEGNCVTVISIFLLIHFTTGATNCDDLAVSGFWMRSYMIDHGPDDAEKVCCGDFDWPGLVGGYNCPYSCSGTLFSGCTAGVALSDPGHPEYSKIHISC